MKRFPESRNDMTGSSSPVDVKPYFLIPGGQMLDTSTTSNPEQYREWRDTTPFLYDYLHVQSLEWPSLTCEWLPGIVDIPSPYRIYPRPGVPGAWYRLLAGTHTINEQNYLMVIGMFVPDAKQKFEIDQECLDCGEFGGFDEQNVYSRNELMIKHKGEVNRARCMPQNPAIVATKPPSFQVFVFNILKDRSAEETSPNVQCNPDLILTGHTNEGYGLDWNSLRENHVASGSDDKTLCIWDIGKNPDSKNEISPLYTRRLHTGGVEDVRWHKYYGDLCISVGDDRCIAGWDVRSPSESGAFVMKEAHQSEINSIDTSPFSEFFFITGAADQFVNLWDLRYLNSPLNSFVGHYDEVFQTQFNPLDPSTFASGGYDGKVIIWNINRIPVKNEPSTEPYIGQEACFVHRGHMAKMSDFNFHKDAPWLLCSVAADNALHTWRPSAFSVRTTP